MAKLAIGILAAGCSKRLGRAKQLVNAGGISLLQRQVNTAVATGLPVTVVLSDQDEAMQMREQLTVPTLTNQRWASGMASSIKCVVNNVQADAWLLLTVDQYRLDTQHLNRMIGHWQGRETTTTIVASVYDSIIGVPALIPSYYKNELNNLTGDQGAGRMIRQVQAESPHLVIELENQELRFDVDTVDDLLALKHYFQRPNPGVQN
ncbi:NTP transferase domain-containing protein [Reinekea sp.]|jgi:CTP:molybdopterin cytidylyltransferase MocA|uniref:nucleotidyltransferase family protein n=1 Tax=Reinekea sp. TaxID=1970455 RepID=UPI00398929B8